MSGRQPDKPSDRPVLLRAETQRFKSVGSDLVAWAGSSGSPDPKIVIFTRRMDRDMDALGIALLQEGLGYLRIDSEDVLTGRAPILRWDHQKLDLEIEVKSGPLRPCVVVFHGFDLAITRMSQRLADPDVAAWAHLSESWSLLRDALGWKRQATVNSPTAVARMSRISQLCLAHKIGLRTPRSVVTTGGTTGVSLLPGSVSVILKPLGEHFIEGVDQEGHLLFDVGPLLIGANHYIPNTGPLLVQEWIPHSEEHRVYAIIGKRAVGIKILSADGDFKEPYRLIRPQYSTLELEEVPQEVDRRMQDFLTLAGLDFGAADFVSTRNGEWIFLELNTSGGWRCYEEPLGIRLITDMYRDLIQEKLK
jgi:hypothetical protein